jgi:hypothetical protein
MLALGKLRQEDLEFDVRLSYIARPGVGGNHVIGSIES